MPTGVYERQKKPCAEPGCSRFASATHSQSGLCRYHWTRAWKKRNAERVNAHNRRYNAANVERANAWRQKWASAHPEAASEVRQVRRARKQGQFVEKVCKSKLVKLKGAICGICVEPVDPANFQLDHVIPIALGGEHSYANCQPAHGQNCRNSQGMACNQIKARSTEHVLDKLASCASMSTAPLSPRQRPQGAEIFTGQR